MAPKKPSARPHGMGYNGHAKCCDCKPCAEARKAATLKLWADNGEFAVPASADHTVFVKSFFRRAPNHLIKRPNARRAMLALVRDIRRMSKQ